MSRTMRRWLVAAAICGVSACHDRSSSRNAVPPNQTAPPLAETAPPKAENAPPVRPETPDSPPAAAVRRVLEQVDAGHLEALADFLPLSYQHDVEGLVRTIAEKLPDEQWTRWQSLAEKFLAALKRQAQLQSDQDEEFVARLSGALDRLSDPAAWDRGRWKEFELRSFLNGPASDAFAAWRSLSPGKSSLLSETTIRTVESDAARAVLEFQSPVDPEPRTIEFVLVEEKWIPKSLSEGWEETVRKGKRQLDDVDPLRVAERMNLLRPTLLQIEGTLDQMLAEDHADAIQLGWWQIQSLLIQARQSIGRSGPPPSVEIRIAGELSDQELNEFLDELVPTADDPEKAEYVTFPTARGMTIQLSPVENLDAFLRRLTFATVKGHDAETRSVDVEPKRSR